MYTVESIEINNAYSYMSHLCLRPALYSSTSQTEGCRYIAFISSVVVGGPLGVIFLPLWVVFMCIY